MTTKSTSEGALWLAGEIFIALIGVLLHEMIVAFQPPFGIIT
jgi:hypothetical protein